MMRRRLPALIATLAIHLALVAAWQLARAPKAGGHDEPRRMIELLRIAPALAAQSLPPKAAQPPPRVAKAPPPAPVVQPPAAAVQSAPAPEAPAVSVAEILKNARRDIGKIDQDLRRSHPGQPIKAPPDTAQIRLAKGIAHAAEMAPPRWYQAPKSTEILDPGGYGRRRYRVITAKGTYCYTYESNHAPDGRDVIRNGPAQKLTTCDVDEQPATRQKW